MLGVVDLREDGYFNASLVMLEYDFDFMKTLFYNQSEIEILDLEMEGRKIYAILHTYKLRILQRKIKKYLWQKKFSLKARFFREINGRWPNLLERDRIYKN